MAYSAEAIHELFNQFGRQKVLVVGDVMIDSYLYGNVERISPEAPVPVVTLKKRVSRLGGASNVALNLKSLGAEVMLCSVIGNDPQSEQFLQLMAEQHLPANALVKSAERITTTKYRIIGNRSQMLRVDEESEQYLNASETRLLCDMLKATFSDFKPTVIILQDYNKGVLSPEIIETVITLSKANNIPVAVDPKKLYFSDYKDVTLFKPNLKELAEGLKLSVDAASVESLANAAEILHQSQNISQVMITLSEHGVFVSANKDGQRENFLIPAFQRDIADVSGAGDTVISVAALCLGAKTDSRLMACMANLAGGLVCENHGVVPVDRQRLLDDAVKNL